MGALELCLVAVGLSMDAFAMAVCKGVAMEGATVKHALTIGLWFGGFQAAMPLLGFFLGAQFGTHVAAMDHWIAVLFLSIIGMKMMWDSMEEEKQLNGSMQLWLLAGMAFATSIDAFVVGVSFAALPAVPIIQAVVIIGVVACVTSAAGALAGHALGLRFGVLAERFGGALLVCMALELLYEHTSFLI